MIKNCKQIQMIEEVCEYNQHFVAMMNIINKARLFPPKSGHKHHIIPQSWFKMNNLPVDNSEENLVLLSLEDHQKIHKLLVLCVKDPILKSKMGYAVHRLGGRLPYKIQHSEETKEKIRKATIANKSWKFRRKKKWTDEEKKKLSDAHKGQIPSNKDKPKTDFGEKFFEKFGLHYHDNVKLFVYHYNWYKRHNNTCKWEV